MIWFLLFLILIELFIFRNLAFYGIIPASFIGQIQDLYQRFDQQEKDKIEWLILGDSQSMDAIRPPLIARELKCDPDQIFNLSISAGKPLDSLNILEKTIPQLPNLKGVIIAVNEHQFNNSKPVADVKFRYFAGITERIQAPGKEQKAELILGYLSYAYGLRDVWWKIAEKAWEGELPQIKPVEYRWGLDPLTAITPDGKTMQYAIDTAERWLGDYRLEGPQTNAFLQMVNLLERNEINWTLVKIPRMSALENAIKSSYEPQQKEFINLMKQLALDNQKQFITDIPQPPENAYRDVNHVNEKGAAYLAPLIADIIKEMNENKRSLNNLSRGNTPPAQVVKVETLLVDARGRYRYTGFADGRFGHKGQNRGNQH